jgi:oligoendopeptidase F
MNKPLPQKWDIDTFFSGGSQSEAYLEFLDTMERDLQSLKEGFGKLVAPTDAASLESFVFTVNQLQDLLLRLREASAFISCLTAQDMSDKQALLLGGRVRSAVAQYETLINQLSSLLSDIPDSVWQEMMEKDELRPISFRLSERRQQAKERLSTDLEALATDLAIDGYHGWSELYDTTVSKISIPFEENGETKMLSAGQAYNKLSDHRKEVRDQLIEKWEKAWEEQADFCAAALNHLAGFRLKLYEHRGWDSIHKEPLDFNRMSVETLQVMWETIEQNKDIFLTYFERKAKLLGIDQLSWADIHAPLGSSSKTIAYDDAADFIVEQFRKFSPKLASFTVRAFEEGWIEAEDRAGKRPGGFCTTFSKSKQSRIFMTYSGTASNVSTLAHELGHAYHQHVMNDLAPFAQEYAMNVAETASTFAEMLVSDAAVKASQDPEEKLFLLDDKIQRSVAFFMNIHARFIFETNFYAERKNGLLSVERLNELMVEAQKQAYREALSSYHPHFWASKLHFYITRVPFYNFPYTFGFLFSAGIYARAMAEGKSFEDEYIALLQDTASMRVEDLAMKHLGVDLTKPEFWQSAIDVAVEDVKQFLALTGE